MLLHLRSVRARCILASLSPGLESRFHNSRKEQACHQRHSQRFADSATHAGLALKIGARRLAVTLTKTQNEQISSGNAGGGAGEMPRFGGDGNEGKPDRERQPPPEGYRIAMWLTLTWVTMLFITLVVVYLWLDAQHSPLTTPRLFWLSTGVVLSCSMTLESARRALRQRRETAFNRWLRITLFLGLAFLITQYLGLRQLSEAGFFASVNKRAWLAFLITGSHGAHLFGGMLALVYLVVKNSFGDWTVLRRRATMDTTTIYWHFIDVLWLFLFSMLFLWN